MPILRRDRDADPDVPMTPIIDMVFLLLIFFLVTASLKKPVKVLPIELEPATYAKDARLQEEVIISVTDNGERYLWDGKAYFNQAPVDRGQMMEFLHDLSRNDPEMPIRLDIDREAQWYHIQDLMNNMALYNLNNIMPQSRSGAVDEDA